MSQWRPKISPAISKEIKDLEASRQKAIEAYKYFQDNPLKISFAELKSLLPEDCPNEYQESVQQRKIKEGKVVFIMEATAGVLPEYRDKLPIALAIVGICDNIGSNSVCNKCSKVYLVDFLSNQLLEDTLDLPKIRRRYLCNCLGTLFFED